MSTNKTFNKVQLDVKFTQAATRANLISEENISISFGKISKYFADLHSQAFTGYTHPTYTAHSSGLYKITVDSKGHVSEATAVAKADITALGIPGSDTNTTYTIATGDSNGQIKVTPSSGSAYNVSVKGLGSAAYTASTSYVPINGKAPNGIGRDGYVAYAHDGFLNTGTGTVTGALVITTPFTKTKGEVMLKFTVDIYNYNSNTSVEYKISGYAYNDGKWYNCTAYCVSSGVYSTDNIDNLTVRFGYVTDGFYQVQIGETTTNKWSYPRINVHDISITYTRTNYTDANSGWSLEFVTSGNIPNITQTITNTAQRYLPLSGGTMTGDITFASISGDTYPISSKGIKWGGGTDAIDMYYNLRASDTGEFIINMRDDSNVRISFAYNGTVKSYIDTNGTYNGNASTATKLGTANKGSATKGIYLNAGAPAEMTYSLGSTVNAGTANQLAYYSGANAISATHDGTNANDSLYFKTGTNTKSARQIILGIYGQTYGNDASTLISGTAGVFSYGDGGPQIDFNTSSSGSQAGALIFTDHDTAGTGASWHFVSNQSDWNVTSKRFHARTSISIGTDLPQTSHNLYVNGTTGVTGVISSTYKSTTYLTSLTSSVITLSDAESSFGGWICGPTKNGRIVISSYQGHDDKLYFGYGERGRTENSYAKTMTWDGPTNTLTADKFVGALQGNVTGNCSGTSSNVTGTVAIANGGTGATTRLGALRALTEQNVGTSAQYFLTITDSWVKGGYTSVADVKTVLGLGSAAYTSSTAYLSSSTKYAGSSSVGGAATNVATEVGNAAGARPVFYAYLGDNTRVVYNTNFTYNPSGNVLTATTFVGALSGNATSATILQTARNINGVSFDGSANITIPRSIKRIHTASGTEGTAGWVKIARITVTAAYANHPMTFTIAQRGIMQYRIHLVLVNNGSVAAAAISQFIIARDNSWTDTNNYPRAYIIKPSDGIFDLYIRKTEAYDHIFVVDFTKADGSEGDNYSVAWTNVHAADSAITGGTEAVKKLYLPTTTNYAGSSSAGGAANSANVLNYNNSVTATTSGLQYTHGQITIGAADGNAAEGSNASYKLWSYPTGGTATSSTSANIQNLRLYWSSAYFRDIFLSPNNDMIYHRAVINNSAKPWYVLLDSNNLETYSLHTPDTAKALSLDTGQNMSPITRPQNLHNRSNKLALIPGSNITVEYSTDAGSNWTDMGLTADKKGDLFNDTVSASIPIGPNDSTNRTTSMQTRITITCDGRDQTVDQYILWLNSSYQTISIDLQVAYGNATTTFTNIRTGLSCPPWRYQYILNTETKRFGTGTTNAYVNKIRFVIKYTAINGSYKTSKAIINSIAGYSGIYWGGAVKNNLMIYDHLYTWDNSQNATFPAQLNATGATFTSSSYGALSIKRTSTNNAGIKFYNNGSTYLGSLAIDTVNGTFHRFKTDESTMYEIIDRSVVRNNTTVGTLGWTSSSADTVIPTVNTIAYWNGAYSGTSSNLAYCNKGAFGTIVTKSTTDYSKVTSSTTNGKIKIDGTDTTVYTHPSHTSKTSGLYKITVDTLGHVSSTASVAKGDIPALDYLPLSGGSLSGSMNFKSTTYDGSAANNGVSSGISYPTTFNILDKSSRILVRLEGVINSSGSIGSYWYVRNYNTSGTQVDQKGISMTMAKDGTLTYTVSDGAKFRSAIGAGTSSLTIGTTSTTAAAGDHAHGLLHSNLTQAASNGTTGGWSVIGIDPAVNGYVLKSIRINQTSPNWLSGDFGAGIAFGGADTKGVISMKYDSPVITFAGGNHKSSKTEPVWYLKISGTSGSTYNLDNLLSTTLLKVSESTNLMLDGETNAFGYVSGLTKDTWNFQQTDGTIIRQRYNILWKTEIFMDYRTGQMSTRGKNKGTWQDWRIHLDSGNYTSYTVTKTGSGASGTWGISITGNASTSTKATQDGDGNTISSTYLKLSGGKMAGTIQGTSENTHIALAGGGIGDYATLDHKNNINISSWYGVSISNGCSNAGTLDQVTFSVNARTGTTQQRGHAILYSASGDSPALIFQRGTFVDNLNDWKIYVSGGELRFAQSTANASSETWTTKMYFHASDGNLYVGSTKVSLNGHTHNYAGSSSAGGAATWATLLKAISTTTTASASTWNIPSGSYQVWGERFSDTRLKYTPSGGSKTTITDTGDLVMWLTGSATANQATLNMRIDGTYYGSFSGNITGNVTGNVNGKLYHTGTSSAWWDDRDNAVIRITTGDTGYRPLWTLLTATSGSWGMGNHTGDDLTFNFISKAVYDSKKNPSTYAQIKFTNAGGITATGSITANKFYGDITGDGLNAGIYDLLNVDDPTFNGAEWMLTSIPSSPGGTSTPSFRRVKTAKFADYVTSNSRTVLFDQSDNTSTSISLSTPPTDTQYLKLYFKSSGNSGRPTVDNSVYSIAEVPYMTDVNLGGILQVAQSSDNQGILRLTALAFNVKITTGNPYTLRLIKVSKASRISGSGVSDDSSLSANIIKVVAYR